MATGNINTKSQLKNIRIPHDVIEGIERVKSEGESMAGFLVSAARIEITRRETAGTDINPLLSSLNALAQVEEIGTKVGEAITKLVDIARNEIQRCDSDK